MSHLAGSQTAENQVTGAQDADAKLEVPHAAMIVTGLSALFWVAIIAAINLVL